MISARICSNSSRSTTGSAGSIHGCPACQSGGDSSAWAGSMGVERGTSASRTGLWTRHPWMTPSLQAGATRGTNVRSTVDGTVLRVVVWGCSPASSGRTADRLGIGRSSGLPRIRERLGEQAALDSRHVKHVHANAVRMGKLRHRAPVRSAAASEALQIGGSNVNAPDHEWTIG